MQRKLELASRAVLLFSLFPPAWLVGTAGLSVAKILENMEIGHNVMHGQWDWMRDPKIHSTTWEWDNASPSEQWKHSHNELHHTYTNVIGRDNDLGYGIMRVDEDQRWHPIYLGAAAVELHQRLLLRVRHRRLRPRARQEPAPQEAPAEPGVQGPRQAGAAEDPPPGDQGLRRCTRCCPARRSCTRWPPTRPPTWSATCGPTRSSCAATSPRASRPSSSRSIEGETRGEWYLRQMLGSANITRQPAHAHHDRQPVVPDRAPPVPRPAEQPLPGDRARRCRSCSSGTA